MKSQRIRWKIKKCHVLRGKTLTSKSFSFFSPEHNRKFTAEDAKLKIEKESENPNKYRLNLNGMNILEWFSQKYREVQDKMVIKINQDHQKGKGVKM